VVAPEARLDVLRVLDKMNINAATLVRGLDGFCRSLRTTTQILDHDDWPGVPTKPEPPISAAGDCGLVAIK
jgi:hypothetical protein